MFLLNKLVRLLFQQGSVVFMKIFVLRGWLALCILCSSIIPAYTLAASEDTQPVTAYQRLEKMLPIYEKAVRKPWPTLSVQYTLSKGMSDPAVITLRKRLCKTKDLICPRSSKHDMLFDEQLDEAVKLFQERHNLNPDGVVGPSTRAALNISPKARLQQIRVNLSRLKHLSDQAESRYIWVNVPDCRLRLVDNHEATAIFPVIVGKPSRKTPEINSKITRITINPYWYVPPTILRQDIIPKASSHPDYLIQHHIHVFLGGQSKGEVPPYKINWTNVKSNPARYVFRQDPGPHNALGQIKFEFSNKHAVYLHDTPTKALFEQEQRLFSSGCIRLKDPLVFLSHLVEWDESSLRGQKRRLDDAVQSGVTTTFQLGHPIPIHVTYITAWVDTDGNLHFWDDVYKHDQQLTIQEENEDEDLPPPV